MQSHIRVTQFQTMNMPKIESCNAMFELQSPKLSLCKAKPELHIAHTNTL